LYSAKILDLFVIYTTYKLMYTSAMTHYRYHANIGRSLSTRRQTVLSVDSSFPLSLIRVLASLTACCYHLLN